MEGRQRPGVSARLLFMVTALFWCAQYSYTQFINPELERMGMSAAFMGLVSGAYGFTQMVLRIPLGILSDRLRRHKPFVVIGCLMTMLSGLGFLVYYSPPGFLISRGLAGVASAAWVSFTVLYSSYFPHTEGPRRISQLNAANMGGRLAGYLLIILIVPLLGILSAFWFSALAGGIALLMSLPLQESSQDTQGITLRDIGQAARDPYLLACSVIGILTQVVAFSTYYGFTVNAAKRLGAASAELTWLSISLLVPTLVMNLLITSRRMRVFSVRTLVFLGFVLSAGYCFLVPLTGSLTQLYLIQTLAGFSSSLTFSVLMGQSIRDIPQRLRGVGMGFYQAVYGIGMTLGPILMGVTIDAQGLDNAFRIMAVISMLSGLLSWKLMNIPPRKLEKTGENV